MKAVGRTLWKFLTSAILILEFDGSFRPPRDSEFQTITSKLATCASCIYHSNIVEQESRQPIALGSRFLSVHVGFTSAHAEYDGLLLGLDWLVQSRKEFTLKERNDSPQGDHYGERHLIIQGDCKTVIDQLSGKSLSRKLREKYEIAEFQIEQLGEFFDKIEFRHIPRSANLVCGNLCSNLMVAAIYLCWTRSIIELEEVYNRHTSNDNEAQPLLLERLDDHLQSRWIRYSVRPPLYERCFLLANEHHDYTSMIQVGERLADESQYFRSKFSFWKARGILFQIQGLHGLGQERKAQAMERKHRVLLAKESLSINDSFTPTTSTSAELLSMIKSEPDWNEGISKDWIPLQNQWWKDVMRQDIFEGEPFSIWSTNTIDDTSNDN